MLPRDLLRTADDLVKANNGKLRQANLRRAVSTAYYAMFHTLARCCADLLMGGAGSSSSTDAWKLVYRAVDHGAAKTACLSGEIVDKFSQEIQDFANAFGTLQEKRHEADYDPNIKYTKSEVIVDIQLANAAIESFSRADKKERRAFAAYILMRKRQNQAKQKKNNGAKQPVATATSGP